jgi:hypothetical protein
MGDYGSFGAWLLLVAVIVGAVLIAIGGVLLSSRILSRLANNRAHIVLVSVVTVLLSLLLYLVFVLDHPFGPMGVTSEPFAHALSVFDLVDQGT